MDLKNSRMFFFNIESAIILCRDGCFAVGVSTVLDGNWQHHCL